MVQRKSLKSIFNCHISETMQWLAAVLWQSGRTRDARAEGRVFKSTCYQHLCPWARHFIRIASVHPAGNGDQLWLGVTCDGLASRPGGAVKLSSAHATETGVSNWPDGSSWPETRIYFTYLDIDNPSEMQAICYTDGSKLESGHKGSGIYFADIQHSLTRKTGSHWEHLYSISSWSFCHSAYYTIGSG